MKLRPLAGSMLVMLGTAVFGATSVAFGASGDGSTVQRISAAIRLSGLVQPYDGSARRVHVATEPANLPITVTYNGSSVAPVFPGDYTVRATVTDPLYQGSVTETLTISITALVRHAPVVRGGIDGSMQVLTPESIALSGDAWMSGDLLVPGTPAVKLHGAAMIAGLAEDGGAAGPTNGTVSMSDRAVIGYLMRRIDPISMTAADAVSPASGTADVVVSSPADVPADFSGVRNLTLDGAAGEVVVPPGSYGVLTANGDTAFVLGHGGATVPEVYNLQSFITGAGASVRVAGPVLLVISDGAQLDGRLGEPCHPEWLSFSVASGDVSVGSIVHGYVLAPNSTVTVARGARLIGQVSSNRLVVQPNAILEEPRL